MRTSHSVGSIKNFAHLCDFCPNNLFVFQPVTKNCKISLHPEKTKNPPEGAGWGTGCCLVGISGIRMADPLFYDG